MAIYPRPDDLMAMVADLDARVRALESPALVRAGTARLSGGHVYVYSPALTPESTVILSYYQLVSPMADPGPLMQDHSTPGRMEIVALGTPGSDAIVCWAIVD